MRPRLQANASGSLVYKGDTDKQREVRTRAEATIERIAPLGAWVANAVPVDERVAVAGNVWFALTWPHEAAGVPVRVRPGAAVRARRLCGAAPGASIRR